MTGMLRSAMVIARRDFAATVLSKTFIFFLLGPLFPLLLGGVFEKFGFDGFGMNARRHEIMPLIAQHADDFRGQRVIENLAGNPRVAVIRFGHGTFLDMQTRPFAERFHIRQERGFVRPIGSTIQGRPLAQA